MTPNRHPYTTLTLIPLGVLIVMAYVERPVTAVCLRCTSSVKGIRNRFLFFQNGIQKGKGWTLEWTVSPLPLLYFHSAISSFCNFMMILDTPLYWLPSWGNTISLTLFRVFVSLLPYFAPSKLEISKLKTSIANCWMLVSSYFLIRSFQDVFNSVKELFTVK